MIRGRYLRCALLRLAAHLSSPAPPRPARFSAAYTFMTSSTPTRQERRSKAALTSGRLSRRANWPYAAPALCIRRTKYRRRHELCGGRPVGEVWPRHLHSARRRARDPQRLGQEIPGSQPTTRSTSAAASCSSPRLGVGARINNRLSVEASWVHMSHAQLFAARTPGSTISACA